MIQVTQIYLRLYIKLSKAKTAKTNLKVEEKYLIYLHVFLLICEVRIVKDLREVHFEWTVYIYISESGNPECLNQDGGGGVCVSVAVCPIRLMQRWQK